MAERVVPTDRPSGSQGRGGKKVQVKNKAPAPVQITAEQILRESEVFREATFKQPNQRVESQEELDSYRVKKRKEFEDSIKRSRENIATWVRYAAWEASQAQMDRARSVMERALDVDYRNQTLWLKYAEMEMTNKFINHARNVWDRAVTALPRVDQFWYKFVHMEEMLGNVGGARQIMERWMKWQPDPNAWQAYAKLEIRHKCIERAREIYERFLVCHPDPATYLKYIKFEKQHGDRARARLLFERAQEELASDAHDEELFIQFAQFEIENNELERARVIFKFALDNLPKAKAVKLYQTYTAFEKQRGDKKGIEDVILSKRRLQYEEELEADKLNYDVWFDYLRLEESSGDKGRVREVYERAIANLPPINEKIYWKRYIYLWINFALYEELEAKDTSRTRMVYEKVLQVIPHELFTFSKIWLMAAHFEVRQKNLDAARKILGTGIGKAPREKMFKGYIELEMQLGNIDRCRKLYEKYLEFMPENCQAWSKFAELESGLGEIDRARAIFELAVNQPVLDMPEVVWKAFIDMEIRQGKENFQRVRYLYKRLLQRTKHVKVWVSHALFEASTKEFEKARAIFEEADSSLKGEDEQREERKLLLESYRDFEVKYGTPEKVEEIKKRLPRRVKKKRQIILEDGSEAGWEEYWHYIFPDEETASKSLKILEMARKWKKQKKTEGVDEEKESKKQKKTEEVDEEKE
eukprot:gb/GEZN01003093.1/.p1 GENE.gb/GEZN01003093.1/~~gb/GEZN01003093.1/.p1  ORF type:complete len:699 (-),score=138.96 gb/GEZN01003093.1/:150-2246(-)